MTKFQKRPIVIEAVQFDGSLASIESMDIPEVSQELGSRTVQIPTLEGVMTASPGDWIIKGVKGEFYPCKDDIFQASYERPSTDAADNARRFDPIIRAIEAIESVDEMPITSAAATLLLESCYRIGAGALNLTFEGTYGEDGQDHGDWRLRVERIRAPKDAAS